MNNQLRVPQLRGKSLAAMDRWFQQLDVKGFLFNPDDRPEEIVVMDSGMPTFSEMECEVLNESLDRLFAYHNEKVYDVALKYFHKAIGIKPEHPTA